MYVLVSGDSQDMTLTQSTAGSAHDVAVSWVDITSSAMTPGVTRTAVSGTSATTIVARPAASTQRVVKEILLINKTDVSTKDDAVEIKILNSNGKAILGYGTSCQSFPGDMFSYTETKGWSKSKIYNSAPSVLDVTGKFIQPLYGVSDRANATATIALTSTSSAAVWMGPVNYAARAVVVQFRVTTNPATLTYVECAICQGTVAAGSNFTLYKLGHIAWDQMIGTGVKSFVIPITWHPDPTKGNDLFFVIGTQATTAGTLRGSLADNIQSGIYGTATVRPGAIPTPAGAGTAFTIAGATAVIPLVQGYYV